MYISLENKRGYLSASGPFSTTANRHLLQKLFRHGQWLFVVQEYTSSWSWASSSCRIGAPGLLNPWQSIFTNCTIQDKLRSLLVPQLLQTYTPEALGHRIFSDRPPLRLELSKTFPWWGAAGSYLPKKREAKKSPKKWLSDTKWILGLLIFICAKGTNFTILSP